MSLASLRIPICYSSYCRLRRSMGSSTMAVCSLCEITALSMAHLRFQYRCTEADMADTFVVPLVITGISIQV